MSITKECWCCGLLLVYPDGLEVYPCPACGAENERPKVEGLMLENFRNAIRLQKAKEFDRAKASYDLVFNADPDNAEALWGRVLCHYGAVPMSDGGRTFYMVHRPDDATPLREQADYKYACELATPAFRAQMEEGAAYIDRTILRIRNLAETKPAYDVFLCHKCSRPEGGYTEDYKRAIHLYMKLKEKGYRVFFAPVEMEKQAAGEDYEAMIYHALKTSRVMLVICSDREYLHSKWVQAEWQRYLRMMVEDQEKRLIPLLYGGMDIRRLPAEFNHWNLQCINMEGDGYELVQENLRRIFGTREPQQGSTVNVPSAEAPKEERQQGGTENASQTDRERPEPAPRNGFGRFLAVLVLAGVMALGAYYLLQPRPVSCQHPSSSWRQVNVSYSRYSDDQHRVTEEKALLCADCGETLKSQTGASFLEQHTFAGTSCTKCGANATPTPKPATPTLKAATPTPTPKPTARTTAVWEVKWDGTGVSSHVVNGGNVGGLDEGVYPQTWVNNKTRFRAGEVICFRGELLGNGSQNSVKLGWRVIKKNDVGKNETITGEPPSSYYSVNSSFIVWFKGWSKGDYYLEVFYNNGSTQVIGRYDFELY